jgi:hypothetical protein
MLIYFSNLIFFFIPNLSSRFVDIVHEAPLSGQRQSRSVVGGTLYCILLASECLLALLCFLNIETMLFLERLPHKQFTWIYPRKYMYLISASRFDPFDRSVTFSLFLQFLIVVIYSSSVDRLCWSCHSSSMDICPYTRHHPSVAMQLQCSPSNCYRFMSNLLVRC